MVDLLSTCTINIHYQHILTTHAIYTRCQPPYEHSLSTHPHNIPYRHTLSIHSIYTCCQHTLSTRTINAHYQHPLNSSYSTPCSVVFISLPPTLLLLLLLLFFFTAILKEFKSITNFLRHHNPDKYGPYEISPVAIDTFVKSCAASCVISYILGKQ